MSERIRPDTIVLTSLCAVLACGLLAVTIWTFARGPAESPDGPAVAVVVSAALPSAPQNTIAQAPTVVAVAPQEAVAAAPPASTKRGENAALRYWLAIAEVHNEFTDEEDELIGDWSDVALDAKVEGLLPRCEMALRLIHLGAQLPECEWGLAAVMDLEGPRRAPLTLPGHTVRNLVRLGLLRARWRMAHGDKAGAMDDVVDMMTFAHHLGRDTFLIGGLVEIASEELTIECILAELPHWNRDQRIVLRDRLRAVPPATTFAQCLESECACPKWTTIEDLKQSLPTIDLFDPPNEKPPTGSKQKLEALIAALEKDPASLQPRIDKQIQALRDLAQASRVSHAAFQQKMRDIKSDADKPGNELIRLFVATLTESTYSTFARAAAKRAMLDAAFALLIDGEPAFRKIRDPFGDGPFTLKTVGGEREISSMLIDREQNVSIRIPSAK